MNKDFKIEINEEGEKVLVKIEEKVLDIDFLKRELNRIDVEKQNIKNQVKFYQKKYNELNKAEKIYEEELENLSKEIDEDFNFDLE